MPKPRRAAWQRALLHSADRQRTLVSMLALVVSLKVKPDQRDRFLAAAEHDSTCSVRDEPGCLRFDVLRDQADDDHYFLHEVYLDEAALAAHTMTPHYARWREAAAVVLAEPAQRVTCNVVFPSDYR